MRPDATARLETLADVRTAVWRELETAAHDARHGWRLPVLASVAEDGTADARTVVLREVDTAALALTVFTDARAAKVGQLRADPRCTLVLWSDARQWQLRLRARAEVHTEGLAATSRWAALRSTRAARDYLSPHAPGAMLTAGCGTPNAPADEAAAAAQRDHFAVLDVQVASFDWLELHAQGHRRARFTAVDAAWLAP